jgi:hypothetical protein
VEFIALLPCIVLLAALVWQAALAGQAMWLAGSAARTGARANAVGGDTHKAVHAVLPSYLDRGAQVRSDADDGVEVRLRIPTIVGNRSLGTVAARARIESQR